MVSWRREEGRQDGKGRGGARPFTPNFIVLDDMGDIVYKRRFGFIRGSLFIGRDKSEG